MKMKKTMGMIILLTLCMQWIFCPDSYSLEQNELISKSALLMDQETGRVLFEKNGELCLPMASTTKIMTCIIALENADLDLEISVSQLATRAPEVKLFLKKDEVYRLEDLLLALMLESSNDVAIVVAEGVFGSVEAFCDAMTRKAKTIGAMNTSYKTPNGLDAEGHYTTAYDLALITRYALDNERFNQIINTKSHSFNELQGKRSFTVNNKNAFLNMYEGAKGVKTGFTGLAGYCFVGAVEQEGIELIAVMLACSWPPNKTYRWRDTIALMDYGFENYHVLDVLQKGDIPIVYSDLRFSIQDEAGGVTTQDISLICREDEQIDIVYQMRPIEEAPIIVGELLGKAIIYIDGEEYTTVDILANSTIERFDFKYCLQKIIDTFLI